MKQNDYRCLSNGSRLTKKGSSEEMTTALNKAIPKNTTTAVSWLFKVFLDCVCHLREIEGRINTIQDLCRHAHSEER